ncbi:MAG TPA: hypothetical protein VMU25_04680 [Candidatus Paceibacterota bacterium]|nr:hypothetical protein [Candidatus Paceibacterota bacterium]
MHGNNPLTQKVNFYVSVSFIFAFGLFLTFTIVQAINSASLFDHGHTSFADTID